jgi:multiple sugar transport system permease protein
MSVERVLAAEPRFSVEGQRQPRGHRPPRGPEFRWAIAFVIPYIGVFCALILYPFGQALWMAARPSLYADLFADRLYLTTIVNTLVFVGLGVNLKMFLALLLSGFFLRPRRWIRALLPVFLLPWLVATAQACVSFHWMLIGQLGLVDGLWNALTGMPGPEWFGNRWLALGADIAVYIWKWLPFWTVIFIVGRMMIAREIYDAAEVDGAIGSRRFLHITFPLLANLYLVCTLVSSLWALGEFTIAFLVSSGAPALNTDLLATLGYRYAFERGEPALAVAAALSALPVLIPIAILLMRRVQAGEVRP